MEKASDELLYNDNYNPEIDESRTLSESYGEPQYGNLLWIRYSYKLATEDEDESYFVYSFETFDDGAYNNFNERCDEGMQSIPQRGGQKGCAVSYRWLIPHSLYG